MKFPDMENGKSFRHGGVVHFGPASDLHYLDAGTAFEFTKAQAKLANLDGSDKELELIHVFRSLKNTQIMHNPIDVVLDDQGRKIIVRGNQRFVSLMAMGFDGLIPYRVWKRVEDIPPYHIEEKAVDADIQQMTIYPKPHVRTKRILNIPRGQVSILPNGSLMLTRTEYDLIKSQLNPDDYRVIEHEPTGKT